jgi:hypothetical protein
MGYNHRKHWWTPALGYAGFAWLVGFAACASGGMFTWGTALIALLSAAWYALWIYFALLRADPDNDNPPDD